MDASVNIAYFLTGNVGSTLMELYLKGVSAVRISER
jgi:hypothetical protein